MPFCMVLMLRMLSSRKRCGSVVSSRLVGGKLYLLVAVVYWLC